MRLSRTDLVPVLTIVAGGAIGASLSFSLLGRSPGVAVPDPVVVPPATAESQLWVAVPQPLAEVRARAEALAREQYFIVAEMNRLVEAREGPGSQAGRRLFDRKEAMHDEIADLEQDIRRLSRQALGETPEQWNEALRTIEDEKLKARVRYSRGLIGIQDREYMREFEAETSRVVEELLQELTSVSMALRYRAVRVRPLNPR